MALQTSFTELVGCDVPIQLAPMPGVGTPELISAVDAAGGMGALGTGPLPAEFVDVMLDQIHARIQGPLSVNILLPFLDLAKVEIAAKRATVVDFYHGPPDAELIEMVHEHGTLVGWQVGSLADAEAAVQAGCDLLIVRGVEGGGRMYGTESLWPLLVEVVDSVDVPVLAAGGIGDARGMAAALVAGAAGIRMGTRFLAATESGVHPLYREALIAASAVDSVLTDEFRSDWPDELSSSRVLRSSLEAARDFDGDVVGELSVGGSTVPLPRFGTAPAMQESGGAVEAMAMYAGESVRFVRSEESATEIVRTVVAGAEELLQMGYFSP
jgi:NAD(P)H-dependent flavin oxidoreductase YrpB (nitropropane dioxygenase family)